MWGTHVLIFSFLIRLGNWTVTDHTPPCLFSSALWVWVWRSAHFTASRMRMWCSCEDAITFSQAPRLHLCPALIVQAASCAGFSPHLCGLEETASPLQKVNEAATLGCISGTDEGHSLAPLADIGITSHHSHSRTNSHKNEHTVHVALDATWMQVAKISLEAKSWGPADLGRRS